MAHDIFISYSSKDKPIADGICANLESAGMRCWIAPRDIHPGEDWPTSITTAISNSKVMVLVFSANSNSSDDVSREIILAANHKLIIIPFKIENIEPEPGKQYYLARTHWLEAMNPPTMGQIQTLVETIRALVPTIEMGGSVQPTLIPLPNKDQPGIKRKNQFQMGYLWIAGALLLVFLAISLWPRFQAMLVHPTTTPPLVATNTYQPSSTIIPLATLTATPTLEPTATPSTGTVTGKVMWGEKPLEGVDIWICSDWIGYCKGTLYRLSDLGLTTDAQGAFTISGIEPGVYMVIPRSPGQLDISFPVNLENQIQINAGETIKLETISECKFDLNVSFSVQNGSVTLHWNAIPGGSSSYYVGDPYWGSGEDKYHISQTTITTERNFDPGNYIWYVHTEGLKGEGESCGIGRFTIP